MLDIAIMVGMLVAAFMAAATLADGSLLKFTAIAVGAYALFAGGVFALARVRRRRLIVREAAAAGLRVVALSGCDGFVHPPELPWWRHWAKYEMRASHGGAEARRYHVFLTGVLFCTLAVTVSLSTDDDYDWPVGRPDPGASADQATPEP
jgi:hypothetical protein